MWVGGRVVGMSGWEAGEGGRSLSELHHTQIILRYCSITYGRGRADHRVRCGAVGRVGSIRIAVKP